MSTNPRIAAVESRPAIPRNSRRRRNRVGAASVPTSVVTDASVAAFSSLRRGKDLAFESHPSSPLTPSRRSCFEGLAYFPIDPAMKIVATDRSEAGGTLAMPTTGGGRYLDLKAPTDQTVVLDLNEAYNPYCAYNARWTCPIPPRRELALRADQGGRARVPGCRGMSDVDRIPSIADRNLAWLSVDEMREVDRIMVDELGIALIQMMENAGRSLADLTIRRFSPSTAVVLAGRGGNGGGGLAAARHLANRGVDVRVVPTRDDDGLGEAPTAQMTALRRMGVPVGEEPSDADVVIDAVIGYALSGDPRGREAELVSWAAGSDAPVLSLDVPSGLDATTGRTGDPCVRADATLTLAMPKTGLRAAPSMVGELYVADISVPPSVYEQLGHPVGNVFAVGTILRVKPTA